MSERPILTCEICNRGKTITGLYGKKENGEVYLRLPICHQCRNVILNSLWSDWEKQMQTWFTDEQIHQKLEELRGGTNNE